MALLDWKDEFALGIPDVDHEHRELIGLINDAYAQLGQPDGQITVAEFLGEIYARIAAHFALEERIMRERRYDEYASHKADHERLLDEISSVLDAWQAGQHLDEAAFARTLGAWFTEHFRGKDARLHRFLH